MFLSVVAVDGSSCFADKVKKSIEAKTKLTVKDAMSLKDRLPLLLPLLVIVSDLDRLWAIEKLIPESMAAARPIL